MEITASKLPVKWKPHVVFRQLVNKGPLLKLVLTWALRLGVVALSIWCAGVLYYFMPLLNWLAVGTVLLLGAAALPTWRYVRMVRISWLAAFVACIILWSAKAPSNEREWNPSVARLPYAEINGDEVLLRNIRNFHYRSETDFDRNYYDKRFKLSEISGVDFITSYWASEHIAHIMVSFAFREEEFLAFSIETRNEAHESYSTLGGFFKQYELIFVAADERDLIGLRTTYRQPNERVYIFRTATRLDNARRLLLTYLQRINSLHENPEHYNTLLTNCSTSILMCTKSFPNKVPVTWQVFLSGYFPEYLYGLGVLDLNFTLQDLRSKGLVNERSKLAGYAEDYSLKIREGIPRREPKKTG